MKFGCDACVLLAVTAGPISDIRLQSFGFLVPIHPAHFICQGSINTISGQMVKTAKFHQHFNRVSNFPVVVFSIQGIISLHV